MKVSLFAIACVVLSNLDLVIAWSSPAKSSAEISKSLFNRRTMIQSVAAGLVVPAFMPNAANADISDGNELPKGASQFNRVVRLKKDLKKVRKRVDEGAAEIDKQEWDNIGKFLRTAYSTGNDMKDLTASIKSEAKKTQALEDIEKLQKYSQAADVSVSKKDGPAFVDIADKMSSLVEDYFNCLYDVPDEL